MCKAHSSGDTSSRFAASQPSTTAQPLRTPPTSTRPCACVGCLYCSISPELVNTHNAHLPWRAWEILEPTAPLPTTGASQSSWPGAQGSSAFAERSLWLLCRGFGDSLCNPLVCLLFICQQQAPRSSWAVLGVPWGARTPPCWGLKAVGPKAEHPPPNLSGPRAALTTGPPLLNAPPNQGGSPAQGGGAQRSAFQVTLFMLGKGAKGQALLLFVSTGSAGYGIRPSVQTTLTLETGVSPLPSPCPRPKAQ